MCERFAGACKPQSRGTICTVYEDLRFEFGPFVITPERATQVRTMLALVDKDLEDHDAELARLHEELMIVQSQRKRLIAQRSKLLSLLSPMRKLPNETLLRIFQYVCDKNLLRCYPWLSEREPPTIIQSPILTCLPTMAISSVCSRWRELALSLPGLWAGLRVEIYSDWEGAKYTGFIDTVTLYLERSRDWPLRLKLIILDSWGHRPYFPSLTLLAQHAHRWQEFKYNGTHSLTTYNILHGLHFPSLIRLETTDSSDLHLFEDVPKLCSLSTDAGPLTTPYHKLDHLIIRMKSASEVTEALQRWPLIHILELGEETFLHGPEQAVHTWPNITTLVVREPGHFDESFSKMVYSSFKFPSLNALVISSMAIPSTWSADPLISFISRSSCMITSFILCNFYLPDSDLIAALRVMPSLLDLEIDNKPGWSCAPPQDTPYTPHFISSLTHHQSTSSLVPKLHSLRLVSQYNGSIDDAGFVRMVESRWFKPGSELSAEMLAMGRGCIRSAVLNFPHRKLDADVYRPLRILDAEGLRVVVSGMDGVLV